MDDSLVEKIWTTLQKGERMDENDVRSFMVCVRKLLDRMPQPDQNSYLTLRLFCNWAVHIEITNSNTGLRLLATINDTLVKILNSTDIDSMCTEISQAIGFPILRNELRSFFRHFGINDIIVSNNKIWATYICHLIEIIRDVPISFPLLNQLDPAKQKIYNKIAQNPIKPGAGVVSIKLSQVDFPMFGKSGADKTMCLYIRTEETTTIVIPLLIDVRQ